MMRNMPQFRVSEAATLLGVSDDTVRRWVEAGRIVGANDPNGRMQIDGRSLAEFAVTQATTVADERGSQVSARNRFVGIVTEVRIDGLVAQVEIHSGANRIVSLFHKAWEKHRLALRHERDGRQHFLPMALALAGVGQSALRERHDSHQHGLQDEALAYFAGAL